MACSAAVRRPRFLTRPRSLLNFIRTEYFSSSLQIFFFFTTIIGAIGAYTAVTGLVVKIAEKYEAQPELVVYLSATYSATMLLFLGWVLVYRKVQVVLARTRQEVGQISKIHHKMAEIVRSAAINRAGGGLKELQKLTDVFTLLQGDLPTYLDVKFGRKDISVTVKYAVGGNAGEPPKLRALFRRIANRDRHNRLDEMNLEDSVVFARFQSADRSVQRIIICDTKKLNTDAAGVSADDKKRNEAYRIYAKDCGFRSVLAFPLRAPKQEGGGDLKVNAFRGFISLDCPAPDAFEPIFGVPMFGPGDNNGSHYRDTEELNFFFGLADSLATLAMLFDEAGAPALVGAVEGEAIQHEIA